MIKACKKNIGIDIGQTSVKAVCLNEDMTIDSYGIKDLSVNANDTEIILALKSILQDGCKGSEVMVGLRGLDVITKNLEVKIGSIGDIEKQVDEELKFILPIDRSEVEVSWEVVEKVGDKVKLILIIVPKDLIKRYKRLIEAVDLKLKGLEINALAIRRALKDNLKNIVLLIDIHGDETNLDVYNGEKLILDRTIPYGGMKLTRALSRKKLISIEEAEILKRKNEELGSTDFAEAYQPVLDDMIAEVVRTISLLNIEENISIEQIYLTGGDFHAQQVKNYFLEMLKKIAKVDLLNLELVEKSQSIDKGNSDKLRLVNAIGLAKK